MKTSTQTAWILSRILRGIAQAAHGAFDPFSWLGTTTGLGHLLRAVWKDSDMAYTFPIKLRLRNKNLQ
jgi:hypothetical protein